MIPRTVIWLSCLALLLTAAPSCTPSGSAAHETAAGAKPPRGGVLRLIQEMPERLDPLRADSVYESLVVNQIFDGLVALDPGLHVVPALASTWTISRDGLTYTFQLRRDVQFQDGSPLTADDVVFTLRRLLSPEHVRSSLAAPYMAVIAGAVDYGAGRTAELPGVVGLDPYTVQIRLERPYLSFLEALTMDGLRVVPRHLVLSAGEEEFAMHPVGSGPFRLESWDAGGLRLVAHAAHYGGPPYLDAVEIGFDPQTSGDAGVGRFRRGELDAVEVPADHVGDIALDPDVTVHRYQELGVHFLGLSTTTPPLDDVRVRQAIAHAIDRRALAADAPATRREASGILPPGLPGYAPAPKSLAYDPLRARELLRQVDPLGRGLPPVQLLKVQSTPAAQRMVERIKDDLAAVGLELEVINVAWSELEHRIDEHTAPAFMLGWIADLVDPDSFLRSLFEHGGAANYFEFEDEESSRLLAAGARELNPVERARIYREAERRILSLAPIVPLHHSVGALAIRPAVHGLEPGPMGLCGVDLERVWIRAPDGRR